MNRKIKIGLRIVISLFFLIIIASQINPTHVIQNVEKANPIYLFLGTLCFAGIIFFQALRLHLIVDQYTRSLGNTLQLILLGIFFNNLVPGSIGGDIYKIYHLKQKDSPLINAATYVILDRIIALSIITISGFIGILFLLPEILDTMARESIYLQIKKNIFLIMAFIAVAGGLSSVIFFKKKHVVLSWIKQKAREIKVALKIVTNQKLAKMVGFSIITFVLRLLKFYLFFLCFSVSIPILKLITVIFLINIIPLIPVSIGGLGVQEGITILGFSFFHVQEIHAASVALVNRLGIWLFAFIGWWIFIGIMRRKKMKRTGKKSLNLESHHKKVNLSDQINAQFGRHRSGWSYVVHHLGRLQNPNGIKLDTFVERTFCWHPDGTKPHLVPWIGFFHVPPNIPRWFHFEQTSTSIFASKAWQESVIHCQGLFTLSKYLKRHLAAKVKVPVHQLIFPTETRQDKWTWDKFINNKEKKLIQVGWWLRRLHAIYQFPQTQYKKIFLNVQHPSIPQLISKEREILLKQGTFKDEMYDSAQNINYLDDADYDDLLSKNLVFLSLYDASASNTIIECIVRDTPILINPLEPVKEYLGENYPFYYTSLAEAEQKVNNYDLIYKTHEFLKSHPIKERLNIEYFLKSLIDSEIYQNLNPAYSSE